MNTELKNAVVSTELKAQYDECVKKLLGHKIILAHILVRSVEDFRDMRPEEVMNLIEGEPVISKVPIEPGLTNVAIVEDQNGKEIVGLNTESAEVNAGYIRFDIIFYVRLPDGISQVIINIEAQKREPTKYDILNRAIFYISRMISSQKNREFTESNYDDIKRVYSIWVCMNMKEDSMNHIHLTDDALIGNHEWRGRLDLINIVMIGISEKIPGKEETRELHRLLGTLLSEKMEAEKKMNILEAEYDIPMEESIEEDVKTMCNLSEGIEERALEAGFESGKQELLRQLVQKKIEKGKSVSVIAEELESEESLIEKIVADLGKNA